MDSVVARIVGRDEFQITVDAVRPGTPEFIKALAQDAGTSVVHVERVGLGHNRAQSWAHTHAFHFDTSISDVPIRAEFATSVVNLTTIRYRLRQDVHGTWQFSPVGMHASVLSWRVADQENYESSARDFVCSMRKVFPQALILVTPDTLYPHGMHSNPAKCSIAQEDPYGYRPKWRERR